MNVKIMAKKSMGISISLILIVLLSQSNYFHFLLNTVLGRSILIVLLLVIAHDSKVLGIIVVLFIVIMFNQKDMTYLEGFSTDSSGNTMKSTKDTKKTNMKPKQDPIQQKEIDLTKDTGNTITNTHTIKGGTEGFDLIGTENTIKRGKQSNQIPVNDYMRQSIEITPFEGYFSSLFSSF